MEKTSLQNFAYTEEAIWELIHMGENAGIGYLSICNYKNISIFLSPALKPYWKEGKNYFQIKNMKVIPGIFLWTKTHTGAQLPIVAYLFDPEALYVSLEKASIFMSPGDLLNSHHAIKLIHEAGGKVFLATSNLNPLPTEERLDEIFANHIGELDGLQACATSFTPRNRLVFQRYAADNNLLISGGDNFGYGDPSSQFGQINLPECFETRWLLNL